MQATEISFQWYRGRWELNIKGVMEDIQHVLVRHLNKKVYFSSSSYMLFLEKVLIGPTWTIGPHGWPGKFGVLVVLLCQCECYTECG